MKTNKYLSIVLAITLLMTAIFPSGIYAEEDIQENPILLNDDDELISEDIAETTNDIENEIVDMDYDAIFEDAIEDNLSVSEDEYEQSTEENADYSLDEGLDSILHNGSLLSDEGYAIVLEGTIAYDGIASDYAMGIFQTDAIVFCKLAERGDTQDRDWFAVTYARYDEDINDNVIETSYVQRYEMTAADETKVNSLYEENASGNGGVVVYNDIVLPIVIFEKTMATLSSRESSFITIISEPEDQTVAPGAEVELNVEAEGAGLKYQWQTKLTPTSEWTNTGFTGNKTATLRFKTSVAQNGRQFRCVITDSAGNTAETQGMTLTITTLSIISEPEDLIVGVGAEVELNVEAEGVGLKYQWQTKLTPTSEWTNTGFTGNKTATLKFKTSAAQNGRQFRCVITDSAGNTAETQGMTLTIATLSIISEPEDMTVGVGEEVELTVEAEGTGLKYQWQTKLTPTSEWTNTGFTGNKTATLKFKTSAAQNGRQFRCVITDSAGNIAETQGMTLTISTLSIISEPEDMTVGVGEEVELTVEAEGVGLKYQWQTKLSPTSEWTNTGFTGNKTATLKFKTALTQNGRQFRCVITDGVGNTAETHGMTLTVSTLTIKSEPEDMIVGIGTEVELTVEAEGDDLQYQWQTKVTPTSEWANTGFTGNKTSTLKFKTAITQNGRQFRCLVTDNTGYTVETKGMTLTVSTLVIKSEPEDMTVSVGTEVELKVEAEGEGLKYQWQTKTSPTSEWANTGLTGNKTDTLKFMPTAAYNGRQYRCIITDNVGYIVMTQGMTLTVEQQYIVNNVVYELIDGIMCVVGYEGNLTSYTIEENVEGYTVTKIGDSAFENNTTVTAVDLPDTIEIIGKRAFANCSHLSSMT